MKKLISLLTLVGLLNLSSLYAKNDWDIDTKMPKVKNDWDRSGFGGKSSFIKNFPIEINIKYLNKRVERGLLRANETGKVGFKMNFLSSKDLKSNYYLTLDFYRPLGKGLKFEDLTKEGHSPYSTNDFNYFAKNPLGIVNTYKATPRATKGAIKAPPTGQYLAEDFPVYSALSDFQKTLYTKATHAGGGMWVHRIQIPLYRWSPQDGQNVLPEPVWEERVSGTFLYPNKGPLTVQATEFLALSPEDRQSAIFTVENITPVNADNFDEYSEQLEKLYNLILEDDRGFLQGKTIEMEFDRQIEVSLGHIRELDRGVLIDLGWTYQYYPKGDSATLVSVAPYNAKVKSSNELFAGVSYDLKEPLYSVLSSVYYAYSPTFEQHSIEGAIDLNVPLSDVLLFNFRPYLGYVISGNPYKGRVLSTSIQEEIDYSYYGLNIGLDYALTENLSFNLSFNKVFSNMDSGILFEKIFYNDFRTLTKNNSFHWFDFSLTYDF